MNTLTLQYLYFYYWKPVIGAQRGGQRTKYTHLYDTYFFLLNSTIIIQWYGMYCTMDARNRREKKTVVFLETLAETISTIAKRIPVQPIQLLMALNEIT